MIKKTYSKIISNESWPLKCVKNMEFRGQIFVVSGIFFTLEVKQCIAMHLQRISGIAFLKFLENSISYRFCILIPWFKFKYQAQEDSYTTF